MGQVGIVHIGTEYFREYAIEPGDQLIVICLRFGYSDWLAVYNHQANAAFKARFPDPDQIDFVDPVNLFIPLAGASTSGKRRRGKPVGDYLIARIKRPDGSPAAGEKFRLTGPGTLTEGIEVTTTVTGDVIRTNPDAGDWYVVSTTLALTPAASAATIIPVRELPQSGTVNDPVKLTRNAINDLTAWPVWCLRCPMCWRRFAVTVQAPSGTAYTCPHDTFNWSTIVNDIQTHEKTFLSPPASPQNPTGTPALLHCRGVELLHTTFGPVRVYWDESRFAFPDGEDYKLWGTDPSGSPQTATVMGRHTWGAAAPRVGGGREYSFHATAAGKSKAYNFAIPSNETTPLTGVLHWITIHHSSQIGEPQNRPATAIAIQNAHFDHIGSSGPGADIGYHFIIDGNGSIYEGRPLGIKGSHVPGFNGGNVGIVIAGDFQRTWPLGDTPTPAQLTSLNALVDALAARFGITSVGLHQERSKQAKNGEETDCPGSRLIDNLERLRKKYPL
jgi:hypothetical protein